MIPNPAIPDGVATLSRSQAAHVVSLFTTRAPGFFDITDEVRAAVTDTGVEDGIVVVYSRHTTAAIKINEHEPLLLEDMERFLARVAPANDEYRHNDFHIRTLNMTLDEQPNGHAHCQHLLLSSSESIPIVDGGLGLGTWQRVFLVELDRPRQREVLIKVIGSRQTPAQG